MHCGQALQGGSWPLPPLSLVGSQSVSPGNRGRLAILHNKEASTCPHTVLLRETEVLYPGSPLHTLSATNAESLLLPRYIMFACTRSWAVSEARNWPKSVLPLVHHQSQFDVQAKVTRLMVH